MYHKHKNQNLAISYIQVLVMWCLYFTCAINFEIILLIIMIIIICNEANNLYGCHLEMAAICDVTILLWNSILRGRSKVVIENRPSLLDDTNCYGQYISFTLVVRTFSQKYMLFEDKSLVSETEINNCTAKKLAEECVNIFWSELFHNLW